MPVTDIRDIWAEQGREARGEPTFLHGPAFQIEFGLRAVWVHDRTGFCIGRFGVMGIDVHHNLEEQEKHGKQCLACTHEATTLADWQRFRDLMLEHYNVEVPDQTPEWLK